MKSQISCVQDRWENSISCPVNLVSLCSLFSLLAQNMKSQTKNSAQINLGLCLNQFNMTSY